MDAPSLRFGERPRRSGQGRQQVGDIVQMALRQLSVKAFRGYREYA